METMTQRSTEDRFDDLDRRVMEGFRRVDDNFKRIGADMRALRLEVKTELIAQRGETNARLDAFNRLTLQVGAGLFATMVTGFLAVVAALV